MFSAEDYNTAENEASRHARQTGHEVSVEVGSAYRIAPVDKSI